MYLTPGQTFVGRYRVDRFIAEGGMGAVFAGMHLATEARVAIKVLRPAMLASPAVAKQFELEAKVAARVRSPYIVQVLDAGRDPETGLSYLVMELLEGKSLEQLVTEHGPLSPEQTVRYLEQVAVGLEKAHGYRDEKGEPRPIVHRDLKPDNLFVEGPVSANPVVKILDFGIAKVLSSTAGVSQDLRGTPLYMACEQATGKPVTPQTDIWALGLIAFYLLTGRAFWKSATGEGTLASLVGEITIEPMPPASERMRELGALPALPPSFDPWLRRCLERNPQQRFETAVEAVIRLAEVLGVQPRPLSEANSAPPIHTHPDSLSATVPIDSAEAGSTGELSVASTHSPTKTSSARLLWIPLAAAVVGGLAWYLMSGSQELEGPATESGVASTTGEETAAPERGASSERTVADGMPSAVTPAVTATATSTASEQPSIAPVAEDAEKSERREVPKPRPPAPREKTRGDKTLGKAPAASPDPEQPAQSAPDPYGER